MPSYSNYDHGYVDLQKQIVRRLKSEKIQPQLFEKLETSFDAVLADENIIMNRVERKRLLTRVTRDVLGRYAKEAGQQFNRKKVRARFGVGDSTQPGVRSDVGQ